MQSASCTANKTTVTSSYGNFGLMFTLDNSVHHKVARQHQEQNQKAFFPQAVNHFQFQFETRSSVRRYAGFHITSYLLSWHKELTSSYNINISVLPTENSVYHRGAGDYQE